MKRLFVILIFLICFSVPVCATHSDGQYYEMLLEKTDSETLQLLESFGIENGTFEEILNMDFSNILKQFLALCRNEMTLPVQAVLSAVVLLTVLTIIQSFASADHSVGDIISVTGSAMLALSLFIPLTGCISDVLSVSIGMSDYSKVLIPVLAGIVTAAGKPTLALCFQGFCFSSAQILTAFCRTSLPVVCASYASLSVCGVLSPVVKADKPADLLRKSYTAILSFSAILFSSLLSVKSVLAGCADTVAVKGVKFIVGNAVPVIGGALSEALNSVISGISLLKCTAGILAIIILIFMNLPSLIELLLWNIALKVLNAVTGILGRDADCKLITAFENLFSIMGVVIVFQMFLYIIAVSLLSIISGTG